MQCYVALCYVMMCSVMLSTAKEKKVLKKLSVKEFKCEHDIYHMVLGSVHSPLIIVMSSLLSCALLT